MKRTRRLFTFLACCWAVAVLLLGPGAVQAGCYRVSTYYKPAVQYAPTYYPPAVASVFVYPLQLFSVGPGYAYAAPPPPAAVVPVAPALTQCDKNLAAFREEMKAVVLQMRQENQELKFQLQQALGGQRPPVPNQQPAPVPQAAPQTAPEPKPGDLSWLTVPGHQGGSCADCHGGAKPVKNIDYTKGLGALTAPQLVKTVKQIDGDTMPPDEEKAYAERGIKGPHPKATKEQKEALAAAIAALGKK